MSLSPSHRQSWGQFCGRLVSLREARRERRERHCLQRLQARRYFFSLDGQRNMHKVRTARREQRAESSEHGPEDFCNPHMFSEKFDRDLPENPFGNLFD